MKESSIKQSFDAFKPESCVFVLSVDDSYRPSGMIAGWNMKCSIDPPLFAAHRAAGEARRPSRAYAECRVVFAEQPVFGASSRSPFLRDDRWGCLDDR